MTQQQRGYSLIEALLVLTVGAGFVAAAAWGVVEHRRMRVVDANAELMGAVQRAASRLDQDAPFVPDDLTKALDERFVVGGIVPANPLGQRAGVGGREGGGYVVSLPAVDSSACEVLLARLWPQVDGVSSFTMAELPAGQVANPSKGIVLKNAELGPEQPLPSEALLRDGCRTESSYVLMAVMAEGFPGSTGATTPPSGPPIIIEPPYEPPPEDKE